MSTVDLVLVVFAGCLTLSAVPTVYRIIVGPTILDRAVATDMFVVLVVLGMALYSAQTGTSWAISSMLALTAFAFVGTVAVARFVAREEPGARPRGDRSRGRTSDSGPGTETAAHVAIHPHRADHRDASPAGPAESQGGGDRGATSATSSTWFPEDDWTAAPQNVAPPASAAVPGEHSAEEPPEADAAGSGHAGPPDAGGRR